MKKQTEDSTSTKKDSQVSVSVGKEVSFEDFVKALPPSAKLVAVSFPKKK